MIQRNCAGGIVFCEGKIFLLKNDKEEWVLPKGVIRDKKRKEDVALERVFKEAGIRAEIVQHAGDTTYEFYSQTRHQPVCNRITWYIMQALNADYRIAFEQGFLDGDYFPPEDAIHRITYSQDRDLLNHAIELSDTHGS